MQRDQPRLRSAGALTQRDVSASSGFICGVAESAVLRLPARDVDGRRRRERQSTSRRVGSRSQTTSHSTPGLAKCSTPVPVIKKSRDIHCISARALLRDLNGGRLHGCPIRLSQSPSSIRRSRPTTEQRRRLVDVRFRARSARTTSQRGNRRVVALAFTESITGEAARPPQRSRHTGDDGSDRQRRETARCSVLAS